MKINGVGVNKIINLYNNNKKVAENNSVKNNKDRIEISSLGKSLSSLSVEENFENSTEKLEKIKNQISQGTYKADSTQTAKKMIDIIKGRGV